jgi:hypothetical protein
MTSILVIDLNFVDLNSCRHCREILVKNNLKKIMFRYVKLHIGTWKYMKQVHFFPSFIWCCLGWQEILFYSGISNYKRGHICPPLVFSGIILALVVLGLTNHRSLDFSQFLFFDVIMLLHQKHSCVVQYPWNLIECLLLW